MGFGVSKKSNFFYNNATAIVFIVGVLCVISIDTITRYFLLLNIEELQNSNIYSVLRVVLFAFLFAAYTADMKKTNSKALNTLYLFSVLCIISFFINATDLSDLFKSFVFTFSFILIYRYGLLLGEMNGNPRPIIISILILVVILLAHYLSTYIVKFGTIAIISNDAIFSVVVFMPFIFLLRNKKMMLSIVLLVAVCTLLSQKRSAIFFVNLSVLVGVYLYYYKTARVKLIFSSFALLLLLFFYLQDLKNISFVESAINRFENSAGNGREEIVRGTLNSFYEADFINLLFGYGYSATIKKNGIPSHNDFIEVMYDYGIIAVILYTLAFLFIASKCIRWFRQRHLFLDYYICYVVAFIMLTGFSLYNSMLFSVYNVVLFLALGLSHGSITSKLKQQL